MWDDVGRIALTSLFPSDLILYLIITDAAARPGPRRIERRDARDRVARAENTQINSRQN